MSKSKLATYIDEIPIKFEKRKYEVSGISIHSSFGVLTMYDYSCIMRTAPNTSWNYAIANDGTIGSFVDDMRRAWTTGNSENDHRVVTIHVSNSKYGNNWPISEAAYDSLLYLCEDICRRFNIPKLIYTGDAKTSNLTLHRMFSDTICPGPYIVSKLPEIVSLVNRRLLSENKIPYPKHEKRKSTAYYNAIKMNR